MHKRIIALCLALCLIFAAVPTHAGAATTQTVSANQVSINAGNSVTLTVTAENFVNVASLDLYIYYDATALTVSGTYNGYMLSGAQADVNTATAGEVKLSAISLEGINGSGTLLQIYFQTNAEHVGTYPIKLAVGDAYDTSLEATQILATDGSVTVEEYQQQETFLVYTNTDRWSLQQEDVLTVSLTNGYSYQAFVSADFTVTYDPEVFALASAELDTALLTEGAIYSVNSSILGQVRISYASTEPVKTSNLLTVKLRVIADRDGTTTVTGQASNVYREDLTAYGPHSRSSTLTLTKLPEVVDYPDAFLETEKLFVGSQSTSVFTLEAGTGIAAADFTVTYDPAVLQCVAVAKTDTNHGGMVIINDNFSQGKIRFSYVNTKTYTGEIPLVQITWEPLQSPDTHYEVTLSGVGVVDAQQTPITLEYVAQTGCIHECVVTPPTCIADGYTTYTCHGCGDSYTVDPVPMLGHDIQSFEAKAPTCTEGGWSEGEGCIRCDYRQKGEVYPALGHDLTDHEAREATCTEIGWHAYQTCSRGDYSSYVELPALGHRVIVEDIALVDPLTVDNSGETAFVVTDGTYYSNNHTSRSSSEFTVTAEHDCTLTLVYGVSSEANFDKLFILLNGSQQDVISGEVSGKTLTLNLTAGDVVTVRYGKDGSVDSNEDRGWASLEYDYVWTSALVDAPAENQEATCTGAVVCAYCQEQIKEALPHTWNEDGTTPKFCTSCGQNECEILGHSYVTEGTEPTCTEPGQLSHSCSVCGHAYTEELAALGHDLVDHAAREATCTEIGWHAYQTCSRGDYSSYAEIASLGHRVLVEQTVLVDPLTVENTGDSAFVLEGGTYYSNNHTAYSSSSFSVTAQYDCTLTLYYGVSSEENYDKLQIYLNGAIQDEISGEVSGNARTFSLAAGDMVMIYYTKDSSVDNGEDRGWATLEYSFVYADGYADAPAEDQEATCTNGVICAYCQTVVKEALEHSYETAVTEPNCTEQGYTNYTCTVCGATHDADFVEALGHSYEAVVTAPTCTDEGYTTYTCTTCGDTYVGDEVDALGHSYKAVVTEPTCTEGGYTTYTCTICGDTYVADQVEATGHSWQDATCTAPKTCSVCGATEGEPLDHSYETVVTAPTCTDGGYTTYTCTTCGDTYVADQVEATGHSYETVVTDPTCTEQGYTTYTCPACGDSYVSDYVEATGHSWQGATCTTARTCSVCGATEGEPLGHSHEAVVTAPTCTEQGHTTYTCPVCGDSYVSDYMEATGHSWLVATCTTARTCSVCGATEGEPLGHSHEAVVTAPTCTEQGYTTYTCAACGDSYVSDYMEATGHSWLVATCTTAQTCSVCGATDGEPLDHSYETVVTAPTCTEGGYTTYTCPACGDSYVADYVEATGHSWSAWEVTVPATCTEPGEESCSCVCGLTQTREIPAGHSFENGKCTGCGTFENEEAALRWAMDLSGDGQVTAFDAQILAEALAGSRTLTDEQWTSLDDLTPEDILDYVLGRYVSEES